MGDTSINSLKQKAAVKPFLKLWKSVTSRSERSIIFCRIELLLFMAASRSPFTFHAIPVPSLDKGIAATADKRWEKFIKARDGKKGQSARAGGGIKRAPLHPTMWHKQAARAVTCTTLVLREGPDPDSEKKPGKLPSATEVFVIEVHSLPPRAASPGQEDTDSQPTGLPTLRALVSDSPLAASPPLGWVTAINDRCAAPLHTWHGHCPAVDLLRRPSSHHFLLLLPSPPSPSPPFTSTAHSPVRSGARLIEFFDEVPLHSLDHSATTDTSRASAAAAPPGFFSSWPPVLMFGTSASPSGSPRGSPLGTPRLGSARTERGDNGRHTVFSFPRQASCGASPFPFPLLLSESSCANVLSPKLSSTFHSPFKLTLPSLKPSHTFSHRTLHTFSHRTPHTFSTSHTFLATWQVETIKPLVLRSDVDLSTVKASACPHAISHAAMKSPCSSLQLHFAPPAYNC